MRINEPEQYIFNEWDSMCAKAHKSLHFDRPSLENETLVEMHKYVGALRIENDKLREMVNLARDEYIEENSSALLVEGQEL